MNALDRIEDLTERELQVFVLLGQGQSQKAVALQLDLAPSTVGVYASRIGDKLGGKGSPRSRIIRAYVQVLSNSS